MKNKYLIKFPNIYGYLTIDEKESETRAKSNLHCKRTRNKEKQNKFQRLTKYIAIQKRMKTLNKTTMPLPKIIIENECTTISNRN